MCGRFALSQSPSAYADWFGATLIKTDELAANYNVAPTDPVYAVAEGTPVFENEPLVRAAVSFRHCWMRSQKCSVN